MNRNWLSIPIGLSKAVGFLLTVFLAMLFTSACASESGAKSSDRPSSQSNTVSLVPFATDFTTSRPPPTDRTEVKREFHANPYVPPTSDRKLAKLEKIWGIGIVGVRLASAGFMLDFRFKVTDPEKAAPLLARRTKPYLIDEKSGAMFAVPVSGKVGALRQDTMKPTRNRIYYSFFANPGNFIKRGDTVTIVIGTFKAENLVVQ